MQDIVSNLTQQLADNTVKQQEKIIKEITEQGYKYLIINKDFINEDNTIKCNIKYCGSNSEIEVEVFIEKGFEVFDLTRVKEYLKRSDSYVSIKIKSKLLYS